MNLCTQYVVLYAVHADDKLPIANELLCLVADNSVLNIGRNSLCADEVNLLFVFENRNHTDNIVQTLSEGFVGVELV